MTELLVPTTRQRAIAALRTQGMRDDEIVATLRPRGETIIVQQAPPVRNNVRWIVSGCVLGLAMIASFGWSMFTKFMSVLDLQLERNHEVTMSAVTAVKATPKAASADPGFVVVIIIGAAALCIVLGILRKLLP